jgi:hypothetical protein
MTAISALGKRQLLLLLTLSSPSTVLLTANDTARSLEKRGLLAVTPNTRLLREKGGGAYRITPDGLRASADALAAGLYDQFIDMKKMPQ